MRSRKPASKLLLAQWLAGILSICRGRELLSPAIAPAVGVAPAEEPDADLGHKDRIYYRLDPDVYKSITGTGNPNQITPFPADNRTLVLTNLPMSKKTVQQVNKEAPVDTFPTSEGNVQAKPYLTQYSQFSNGATGKNGFVHSTSVDPKTGRVLPEKLQGSTVDPAVLEQPPAKPGAVRAFQTYNNLPIIGTNGEPGFFLSALVGVRVATPFFGSGFNFCVEFVSMASEFHTSIRLPIEGKTAPMGATISPTSDGFVIWLPAPFQPTTLPAFGFRYGLQVAQLFGIDFGFGWTTNICGVDFVRV